MPDTATLLRALDDIVGDLEDPTYNADGDLQSVTLVGENAARIRITAAASYDGSHDCDVVIPRLEIEVLKPR